MLLRSKGGAGARGLKEEAQCKLTAAVDGLSYTQAAAEGRRTMPLRWNGSAVACCWSKEAQRDLPAPAADLSYMQAAIEARRTVLFRSVRLEWGGSA